MKNRLIYLVTILNFIVVCLHLVSFNSKTAEAVNFENRILKVKGLVVVDSLGIERVIVGSHLPGVTGATGNRTPRQGGVSGVMLYDSEGQERGGYVTEDSEGTGNAFLTLDSKSGQNVLLIAEPHGASALMLFDRLGKNNITLSTSEQDAVVKIKKNSRDIKIYENEK